MKAWSDTDCRHCRKRIVYANNPYGGYWYHVHSQSVWCDAETTGAEGVFRARP